MAMRCSPSSSCSNARLQARSAQVASRVLLPAASAGSPAIMMAGAPQAAARRTNCAVQQPSWVARSSTETQQPPATSPPQPPPVASKAPQVEELVADGEFSITKISYGSILTPIGVGLLVYGFGAFFQMLPGADVSSLMLIYGFPISVLGFALSYAQLEPVPCKTTRAAFDLRAAQMTDIQKQVREDVTRYRYGDEQHLDEALDKIFRYGKSGGIPRKNSPRLRGVREEVSGDGKYTLVLEFKSALPLADWEPRQPKFQSFFGPGIVANIIQVEGGVEVALVSDGSGAGRTGVEKKDVLPPLVPGAKPRRQD